MVIKSVALAAAATALFSSAVFADTKPVGSGPNPFTDCGIGAALFQDTHWAAVSSNVIWDLGTTAVTSATASPETCSSKNVKTAQFILDTYDNLAEETATGSGEHLTAALNTFGCNSAEHETISFRLRQQLATEVAQPDYANLSIMDKASQYYQALDVAAEGRCSA